MESRSSDERGEPTELGPRVQVSHPHGYLLPMTITTTQRQIDLEDAAAALGGMTMPRIITDHVGPRASLVILGAHLLLVCAVLCLLGFHTKAALLDTQSTVLACLLLFVVSAGLTIGLAYSGIMAFRKARRMGQDDVAVTFELMEEGIRIATPSRETFCAWRFFRGVVLSRRSLILQGHPATCTSISVAIIPRNVFADPARSMELFETLKAKVRGWKGIECEW